MTGRFAAGGRHEVRHAGRPFWRTAALRRTVALLVLLASAPLAAAQSAPRSAPPPDFDPWIARAMQTFEVPGIGLAIVKDDAVVH